MNKNYKALRKIEFKLVFLKCLLEAYIYGIRKANGYIINKSYIYILLSSSQVVAKYRQIKNRRDRIKNRHGLLDLLSATNRKLINRATIKVLSWYEKKALNKEILEFFLLRCSNKEANAQQLSSTACLAILVGSDEIVLSLLKDLISRFPTSISEQQQIGVKAFISGKYVLAETIWTQCNLHREKLIQDLNLDKYKCRFLGPSWFLAIGHIAHLDIYIKHKILNGLQEHKTYYSLPPSMAMPNEELMKLWAPYITKAEKTLLNQLSPIDISILQDEFWSLPFEGGRSRMFSHAGSMVQHRWVSEGRSPLIKCTDLDTTSGELVLKNLGIPIEGWYVCLHVREEGFHRDWHKLHPSTRSADVMTYLPAIREIIARGGYVVRLGDSTMRPLPKEKGLIDYAHSKAKSKFMDVYLCARCKFFIGTNSGLGLIPPIFGVPSVLTNWSPVGLPQWYPNDIYIPKLIYSTELGRNLTFREMIFSRAGWEQFEKYFTEANLKIKNNSQEDIKELILEMLDRKENKTSFDHDYLKIDRIVEDAGSYKGAKLSNSFIQNNIEIFSDLGINKLVEVYSNE